MTAPPSAAAYTTPPIPAAPRWPGWLLWPYRLACLALGGWLLICLLLALFQRRLIYHPTQVPALAPPSDLPWATAEALQVTTEDGQTLNGWRLSPKSPVARARRRTPQQSPSNAPEAASKAATAPPASASTSTTSTEADAESSSPEAPPVVLYFCGNAGHRGYRLVDFEVLIAAGAEVCCFDYRGYGDNLGTPTEADLRRDARSAWNLLTGPLQIPARRIVLFGESLGGGVATRLAADVCADQQIPGGLVLRSTFNSLREIAAAQFSWVPVGLLLVDRYESQQCVGGVTCPVLSLHGERDTIVPLTSGRMLFNTAPPQSHNGIAKQFVPLPRADHNDVIETETPRVLESLRRFFAVVTTL
ncbi:MAG: alpha/beta hydrolase [Planctomycetaceae bacterium]